MRQHPAWIFLSALQQLRGMAIPLIVLLVGSGQRGDSWFLVVGGVAVLLGVAARAASWWQFRYEVSDRELRVRSGLLAKRERTVPLDRIQAVDVAETPLQRLFGVVGLRVETAAGGGGGADVVLQAVSRAEAERLRGLLVAAGRGAAPTPAVDAMASTAGAGEAEEAAAAPSWAAQSIGQEGVLLRRLGMGDLVVAGATSGRIGPALALVGFGFQFFDDIVPDRYWEQVARSVPLGSIRGVVTLALIVGVGAWLLAIVSTVLTFGGFELRRDGERLLVAHGLLDRRRRSIPLGRIQAVSLHEGVLRRPFGLAALRFESAGYGRDTAESGILWPLLRRGEADDLLRAAAPSFAVEDGLLTAPLAGPPPRARGRYLMADVWPLLGLAVAMLAVARGVPWWIERTFGGAVEPFPWFSGWWALAPLALVPFALLHGFVRWRESGWRLDPEGRLMVRNGGLARATMVVPRRRLQRRWLEQNPLQRRAALASFGGAIASGLTGGRLGVAHLDAAQAFDLLSRLGPGGPGQARSTSDTGGTLEGAMARPLAPVAESS